MPRNTKPTPAEQVASLDASSLVELVNGSADAAVIGAAGERVAALNASLTRRTARETVTIWYVGGLVAVADTAAATGKPRTDVKFADIGKHLSLAVGSDVKWNGYSRAAVSRMFDAYRAVPWSEGAAVTPTDLVDAAAFVAESLRAMNGTSTATPKTPRQGRRTKAVQVPASDVIAAATRLAEAKLDERVTDAIPFTVGQLRDLSDQGLSDLVKMVEGERERRAAVAAGVTPPPTVELAKLVKMTKRQLAELVKAGTITADQMVDALTA
jgi:hypothetical protein